MPILSQFEDLEIWKDSHVLLNAIYDISATHKFAADWALKDQIRRASISITSNIAEGFGRNTNKQFIQFLYYAKGSTYEVKNQLYIALARGYINKTDFDKLSSQAQMITRKIGSLINYLSKHPRPK